VLDAPIFTSPLDSEIAGDDPLGLAPVNERLYNAVYPGINNVVRYIRVYSSICWMVEKVDKYFEKHSTELNKGEAVLIANQAYEKIQLVLTWINKEKGYLQLAGTGRQFPSDDRKVHLVFESFGASTASLLEAVAYRPSLTTGLGFLERKTDGTYACTKAGYALAQAFDEHVKTNEKYRWLANVTSLEGKRSIVFSLEQNFDVGATTQAEQDAFLSQFFPSSDLVNFDQLAQNRWFSIHLTLRSVQAVCNANRAHGSGSMASEDEIRACMARAMTKTAEPLNCKGVETVQVWWAVLQLRQLHRLALDVLFAAVEAWLNNSPVVSNSASLEECANALATSAIPGLEVSYASKVSDLQRYFHEAQGKYPSLFIAAANSEDDSADLNLFHHIGELRQSTADFESDGSNEAVSSAYIAIIFCAMEVQNLMKDPASKEALMRDHDQCSLVSLANLVARMQGHSPEQLLVYLVKNWVVLRHFQIVCERSQNADGKNRFRFVLGDDGLERFNPALGIAAPAFAQDKLRHILLLSHQCGLLEERGGSYKLTPAGRIRLKEL